MGWSCTYKEPGVSLTQWFIDRGVLCWSDDSPYQYRVLDSAVLRFVHYAAIERVDKATGDRIVFATVIKTKSFKTGRDGMNFCWKAMTESMGPFEDSCPERILDLLTETDDEDAREWRQRCRAKATAKKSMPKLVAGLKLVFAEPVKFGMDPASEFISELVVASVKGQTLLCTKPDGVYGRYRLTRPWLSDKVSNRQVSFV